jgi:hypothetical protein
MWSKKPHVQLAKCAEAAALRRSHPIGGGYDEAEVGESPMVESRTALATDAVAEKINGVGVPPKGAF